MGGGDRAEEGVVGVGDRLELDGPGQRNIDAIARVLQCFLQGFEMHLGHVLLPLDTDRSPTNVRVPRNRPWVFHLQPAHRDRSCLTLSIPAQGSLRRRFSRAGTSLSVNASPRVSALSSDQAMGMATGARSRARSE